MDTQKEFEKIIKYIVDLRRKKNHDYGDSFIKTYNEFGIVGCKMDLWRKITRLEVFFSKGKLKVEEERFIDTLIDLAITCINIAIWAKNKNGKF